MSKAEGIKAKYHCDECDASFFTQEGLETHFQRQHGSCSELCPIDTAVQKITNIFRHNKY